MVQATDDVSTVELTIDLKAILKQVDGEYVDNESGSRIDRRPLHVVDGQHRKVSCEDDVFLQNFPVFINLILPLMGRPMPKQHSCSKRYTVTAIAIAAASSTASTLHMLRIPLICKQRCCNPDEGDSNIALPPNEQTVEAFEFNAKNTIHFPRCSRNEFNELPNRKLGRGSLRSHRRSSLNKFHPFNAFSRVA